jgi:hypothetical protein
MSNAKVIALINEANAQLIRDFDRLMAPLTAELARLTVDLGALQQAIAPMAADLDRLRAIIDGLDWERGIPEK